MFDNRRFGIKEMQLLRGSLLDAAGTQPKPRRKQSLRGAALVFAASVSLLAIALVLRPGTQSIGVQEATARIAAAVERTAGPQPDQFQFTDAIIEQPISHAGGIDAMGRPAKSFTIVRKLRRKTWTSIEREGAIREQSLGLRYPTETDRERADAYVAADKQYFGLDTSEAERRAANRRRAAWAKETGQCGSCSLGGLGSHADISGTQGAVRAYVIGAESIAVGEIGDYPTDPAEIYDRLHKRVETGNRKFVARQLAKGNPRPNTIDPDQQIWNWATDPFRTMMPGIPPRQRAGLVRVLGLIEGVTATENDGAITFTLERDGIRSEAVFDESTSALLRSTDHVVDPAETEKFKSVPAGTRIESYELKTQRTVSSAPVA